MSNADRMILNLWAQFKANPDSKEAASILKAIVSIDRKGR